MPRGAVRNSALDVASNVAIRDCCDAAERPGAAPDRRIGTHWTVDALPARFLHRGEVGYDRTRVASAGGCREDAPAVVELR
jgi:hypothetical protein